MAETEKRRPSVDVASPCLKALNSTNPRWLKCVCVCGCMPVLLLGPLVAGRTKDFVQRILAASAGGQTKRTPQGGDGGLAV